MAGSLYILDLLPNYLADSWRRSMALRISPDQHSPRHLHDVSDVLELRREHRLQQVMPALNTHYKAGVAEISPVVRYFPLDVMVVAGMGLLFMGAVAGALVKTRLIAIKDPGLAQSLRFENQ